LFNTYAKVNRSRLLSTASAASGTTRTIATDDIKLLEELLKQAKSRASGIKDISITSEQTEAEKSAPKFIIGTYNAISSEGLSRFPKKTYEVKPLAGSKIEPQAILLRSYKLKNEEVPASVRAIGRCGAGTNNIPVAKMTERGIPVFNAPGANANAVKELVICSLLLCSRGIIEGIDHTKKIFKEDGNDFAKVNKRVEAEKKAFVGYELMGKTLGVIGLGNIGASVASTAVSMGMKVIGYDPQLSVEAAWKLPGTEMERVLKIDALLQESDYISLNVPYMPATHHLIGKEALKIMKPTANVINFARGELVDGAAMRSAYDKGERIGRYISDFPDEHLHDHPKVTIMPHLGASTEEAESNSAIMAANQIKLFIETGAIINSVNFPRTDISAPPPEGIRVCIVNRNVPGVLGLVTSTFGTMGFNIVGQVNTSVKDIAYTVLDLGEVPPPQRLNELQDKLASLDGVISSRVLEPKKLEPGYFKVNSKQ